MRLAYLYGAFDLLNVADLDVIAQAKTHCDRLVVGVLTDNDVTALLGRAPITPVDERLALVGHLRSVDDVVLHRADRIPDADVIFAVGLSTIDHTVPLVPHRHSASAFLPGAEAAGLTAPTQVGAA